MSKDTPEVDLMALKQTYLGLSVEIQSYRPIFGEKMIKILHSSPKISYTL